MPRGILIWISHFLFSRLFVWMVPVHSSSSSSLLFLAHAPPHRGHAYTRPCSTCNILFFLSVADPALIGRRIPRVKRKDFFVVTSSYHHDPRSTFIFCSFFLLFTAGWIAHSDTVPNTTSSAVVAGVIAMLISHTLPIIPARATSPCPMRCLFSKETIASFRARIHLLFDELGFAVVLVQRERGQTGTNNDCAEWCASVWFCSLQPSIK